jgi:hypothetical protein
MKEHGRFLVAKQFGNVCFYRFNALLDLIDVHVLPDKFHYVLPHVSLGGFLVDVEENRQTGLHDL